VSYAFQQGADYSEERKVHLLYLQAKMYRIKIVVVRLSTSRKVVVGINRRQMYAVMPSDFRYSCSFDRCFYCRILVLLYLHVLCCDFMYFCRLKCCRSVWRNCWLWMDRICLWRRVVNQFYARLSISDVMDNRVGDFKALNNGKTARAHH